MSLDFYNKLRAPAPVQTGSRIRLVAMANDPDPIPVGTYGTVTGGNAAQLYVKWDNGRTLILLPEVDRFEVVEPTPAEVSEAYAWADKMISYAEECEAEEPDVDLDNKGRREAALGEGGA